MIGLSLFLASTLVPSNTGKAIGTLVAGLVLTWELWRSGKWVWHPLDVPVIGLLTAAAVSTATAHFVGLAGDPRFDPFARIASFYPSSTRADGFVVWLCYGLAVLVAQRLHEWDAHKFNYLALIATPIIISIALFQSIGIELTHYVGNGGLPIQTRVYGTLGNPILYGLWSVLVLAPVTALTTGPYPGIHAPAVIVGLAATWSRAAWIGAAAALAILRPSWRVLAILALTFVLSVVLLNLRHHDEGHITDQTSVTGRAQIWTATAHLIEARPWFGYGTGTMALRLPLPEAPRDLVVDNPHNELLYVAYSFGLVGLFFYLCLWGTAIGLPNTPRPLVAALVGYFVAVQFAWSHIGVANWLFVMLGLTVPLSGWEPGRWNWVRDVRRTIRGRVS